jgi:hypothetical protein
MRFRSFPSFTAFLLNIQYTFGYLAAGFLVSVPIQLLWAYDRWGEPERWTNLWGSLGRGVLCLIPFGLLWLFLRWYPWENMKLPAVRLFELSVTRNATLLSLALLLLSGVFEWIGSFQMLWLLFLLEGVAYAKIKAHTLIFREFYAIEQRQHRLEWYDELSHGLRQQATVVGDRVRVQAREVQGKMRARVRRLARWVGAGVAPVEEPEARPRLSVIAPAPCRYQGRFQLGRVSLPAGRRPRAVPGPQED